MPIDYAQFAQLRLKKFLPHDRPPHERRGVEWINGLWLYEGIGHTWFGRLQTCPDTTAIVELHFDELSQYSLKDILAALALPLAAGMTLPDLEMFLGQTYQTQIIRAISDRIKCIFRVGSPDAYEVGCTVHNRQGLIRLSVVRHDVRHSLAALSPATHEWQHSAALMQQSGRERT